MPDLVQKPALSVIPCQHHGPWMQLANKTYARCPKKRLIWVDAAGEIGGSCLRGRCVNWKEVTRS